MKKKDLGSAFYKNFVLSAVVICLLPLVAHGQGQTFKDSFPEGRPELKWVPFPFFNQDNLAGVPDKTAPDKDNGIGVLKNSNAGGFAGLSYAVTKQVADFHLESMLWCPVIENDKGPLAGIAFLIDPVGGNFYRLVCDFKVKNPVLNLAYVGLATRNFPVYLKFWDEKEVPGGIPRVSGWHRIAVRVKNGKAVCFWDEKELPGGPMPVDKIPSGFAGVYTNFVGGFGEAATKVDGFTLKETN